MKTQIKEENEMELIAQIETRETEKGKDLYARVLRIAIVILRRLDQTARKSLG